MTTSANLDQWTGLEALDCDGESLGDVATTHEGPAPGWLTVKTGLFGRKETLVPAAGAQVVDEQVVLPWSKARIKDAPGIDGAAQPSADDARVLGDYYEIGAEAPVAGAAAPAQEQPGSASGEDAPVTHGEDSELRDPDRGTRRDAEDMILPEHRAGIRPHPDNDTEIDTTTGDVSTAASRNADADK